MIWTGSQADAKERIVIEALNRSAIKDVFKRQLSFNLLIAISSRIEQHLFIYLN